jgi:hypothetical protein
MASLSYFASSSVSDGVPVSSYINRQALVDLIQANYSDTYFDSTDEIGKVYVYYTHVDGRQVKKIVHDGTDLSGSVLWTSNARDGAWQKTMVKAFDKDGAERDMTRALIGTGEDATHTSGVTYLNIA